MAKMLQATGWWRQADDCYERTRTALRMQEERWWRADAEDEMDRVLNNQWVDAKYIVVCMDPDFDEPSVAVDLEAARALKEAYDNECPCVHYWREVH